MINGDFMLRFRIEPDEIESGRDGEEDENELYKPIGK